MDLIYGSVNGSPWGVTYCTIGLSLIIWHVARRFLITGKIKPISLNGPKGASWIFGHYKTIQDSDEPGKIYERWSQQYGPAYEVDVGFGTKNIVICDPKANAYFYSRDTYGFLQPKFAKIFLENFLGRALLWAEGSTHKQQRKALSPAFSNAAIRHLTSVFYDSSYKLKSAWETMLDAAPEQCIDVQTWINRVSLDSIGIAGFGHDFHTLNGKPSAVIDAFEAFGMTDQAFVSRIVILLGPALPILHMVPTKLGGILENLKSRMRIIASDLLERSRAEKEERGGETDKSIIGLIVKAENSGSVSQEDVLSQMMLLLIAGYETTSTTLTWSLIELCRNPEKQRKLRAELVETDGTDPTWDQLNSSLPYLDAVVHEVLRLHPPVREIARIAAEDDIIPFGQPIITKSGEKLDHLVISKGTTVTSPIIHINRSEEFWGPNANEFEPERWMSDEAPGPKGVVAHRHLLSFSDGPRFCIGRNFALTELKTVLTVLIRSYTFELPDGPETPIGTYKSFTHRPKIAGQDGALLNLKVRRVE